MDMQSVIQHFGSKSKTARALGLAPASVTLWGDRVPSLRQLQIERLTGGKLKADPAILQVSKRGHRKTRTQKSRRDQ